MNSFISEKNEFKTQGTINNNIDESGNVILNVNPVYFNQQYIGAKLENVIYDSKKIESLYDVAITEFSIPTPTIPTDTAGINSDAIEHLTMENVSLRDQLSAIIQTANKNSNESDILAAKDIIINLRIAAGQGSVASDFSDTFPYLKL
jgi:hypothetical protein